MSGTARPRSTPHPAARSPVVLIANAQEWVSRSLESILRPNGYAVLKAFQERDVLKTVHTVPVDVVVLDSSLGEREVLSLCRALRVDPYVPASTPILVTRAGPLNRPQMLATLRAGANGVWGQPLDTEEFLLRLEGHVRAKLDADLARREGLLDLRTGLYNTRGLERRARELAAQMDRREASLACVAIAAAESPDGPLAEAETESLARTLRSVARTSDAVGRVGAGDFAVLAPYTDGDGAVRLFDRLARALAELVEPEPGTGRRLRAGYETRVGVEGAGPDAADLVGRAVQALRGVQRAGDGSPSIRRFTSG